MAYNILFRVTGYGLRVKWFGFRVRVQDIRSRVYG
jgi:hypothetical protein